MIIIVKKILAFLFVSTLVFIFNVNPNIKAESDHVVYLSAAEYGYPPFSMETNGEADGFSIQLLKEVAVEMGITIEFKMDYWATIKQELIDGELDILPLVGYTPERDEVLDFTVPYIVMRGNIFVRDGEDTIQSVDDLYGKQVLVLSGDNSEEYARSIGLDEELTTTQTYKEAFRLLSNGHYDAVLAQGLVGEKIISDEGISNVSPVYVFDDDGISKIKLNLEGYEQKFCFAVVGGDDELLSILNEGLSIVSANGTYDRLYSEWFPFLIDNTRSIEDLLGIIIAFIVPLIIVTLGVSILTVRKQVKTQTEKIVKASMSNQVILEAFEKKFDSEKERYTYFLEEALKLSESHDGVMFTINNQGKISINAYHFEEINVSYNQKEMEEIIAKIIDISLVKSTQIQYVYNYFETDKYLPNLNIECLNEVKRAAVLSFKTETDDIFYTLIANKPSTYAEDDITQISILISGFVSMIDRSNYLKQIEYLSYHDSLTGLYNRRYVEERIQEFNHEQDHPISIVFADVNRLKEINDNYGHIHGDELLKKTSELIQKHSSSKDIVARWGGDEFVVIKPKSGYYDAKTYVEFICNDAKQTNFEHGAISIAFGHASKKDTSINLNTCLVEAEKMMYENKLQMNNK